jgi:hypothetical protein
MDNRSIERGTRVEALILCPVAFEPCFSVFSGGPGLTFTQRQPLRMGSHEEPGSGASAPAAFHKGSWATRPGRGCPADESVGGSR